MACVVTDGLKMHQSTFKKYKEKYKESKATLKETFTERRRKGKNSGRRRETDNSEYEGGL